MIKKIISMIALVLGESNYWWCIVNGKDITHNKCFNAICRILVDIFDLFENKLTLKHIS